MLNKKTEDVSMPDDTPTTKLLNTEYIERTKASPSDNKN